MSIERQQIVSDFRINMIEGRKKYLVGAMEWRKRQLGLKNKHKIKIEVR